jgi:RimJ/RimL family protein N-acetyltransferase
MSGILQPVLTLEELVIRPFDTSDAPALMAAYADPAIQRWHGRTMTESEAQDWILAARAGWAAETSTQWAVTGEGDVLLARVGFSAVDVVHAHAEIGYWTLPAARGRGVTPRAVDAVSSLMLGEIGLHRLELNHSTANQASCRVAAKAGYALEGTRRQYALHPDGWHDMHVHGRLASDPG